MSGYRHLEYFLVSRKKMLFVTLCTAVLAVTFVFSLTVGFYPTSFSHAWSVFIDCLTGQAVGRQDLTVIWNGRVPEALTAIIAGAALSAGGAVMQTTLRNPLADPYTMGISSGAFFGVTLAMIAGITVASGTSQDAAVIVNAFVFSLVPVAIILVVSRKRAMTATRIILVGIAVMYVFSAVSTLLMITADTETLSDVYSWRVGTLSETSWSYIPLITAICAVCLLFLMANCRKYNVMMSGESCAHSMGVDTKRTTLSAMTVISLMTASVVVFTGTIGFIGLVGPHIARIFVGSESKHLIPASAVFGALFLLCADCISRVTGDYGLPVGVVSAIVGCPLFIVILIKMRSKEWSSCRG